MTGSHLTNRLHLGSQSPLSSGSAFSLSSHSLSSFYLSFPPASAASFSRAQAFSGGGLVRWDEHTTVDQSWLRGPVLPFTSCVACG